MSDNFRLFTRSHCLHSQQVDSWSRKLDNFASLGLFKHQNPIIMIKRLLAQYQIYDIGLYKGPDICITVDFHWIMVVSSLTGLGNPTSSVMVYFSKNFILAPNTDFSSSRYDMLTSTDFCQVTHWHLPGPGRTRPLTSPAGGGVIFQHNASPCFLQSQAWLSI